MRASRSLITLLLIASASWSIAQSLEQWTAWGDAAFARSEYYGATRFYNGALAIDGGRMSLQWKQAEACRLSNQYDKAAEFYEKVQRKDMGRTHHEALRWLAEMQLCNGKYTEAEGTWRKVLQKEKDKFSLTGRRAENALAGCAIARDTSKMRKDLVVSHLPQPVNTYDSEFGARRGPDSLLYFASLRGEVNEEGEVKDTTAYRTALYNARDSSTAWEVPAVLAPPTNVSGDNANATWSLDGKWFLFTRCDTGLPCRIHIAPVTTSGIGEAHVLPGIGDTLHSTQPMVVLWDDREMLLFASDRPGGEGGTDIWQAELHGGEVRYLNPLGRPVNTPGDERTPWYDNVTNSLWYSSDFLPGHGGYDIFSAAFGDDVFANPVNAGRPINSPANDLYPVYDLKRGEGWLTSNRIGSFAAKGETCCNDLYRFEFPPQEPELIAQIPVPEPEPIRKLNTVERLIGLRERFPLKLYFHNDEPEPRSWATTTPQTYGATYDHYKALQPTYESENPDPVPIRAFFVERVDHGSMELSNLVEALEPVLAEGGSVVLEVRGHASPLARNDYNRNLSMRRIESLRNHLRTVDAGTLAPYMEEQDTTRTTLTIRELPFGEEQSPHGVSDELGDLRRSVYSWEAATERRIEVVALQLLQEQGDSELERHVMQLGDLKQGVERITRFTVRNEGDKPMELVEVKADCGCTTATLPKGKIPVGGSVDIEVVFSGRAPDGPLRRTVTVDTDGVPKRFELVIEGRVVP